MYPFQSFEFLGIARFRVALFLWFATWLPVRAAADAPSVAGEWFGRVEIASKPALMRIRIGNATGAGLTADILLLPSIADFRNLRNVPVTLRGSS